RLFVNFFQPSFKLAEKSRDGAVVRKRYHPPATPCQRLLADTRVPQDVRHRLRTTAANPDPGAVLEGIREGQGGLVEISDRASVGEHPAPTRPTLQEFL